MNNKNLALINELSVKSVDWIDIKEFLHFFRRHNFVMSWGSHDFAFYNKRVLIFKVNGFKFTGYVFINVNGLDLFNVHCVKTNGNIHAVIKNVYIDELIDVIDDKIEFTGETYKNDVLKSTQKIWSKL